MVKVSVKELSSCEKILSVDVSGDLIRQEYDTFYSEISKMAKVPGFRPGKAPRDVLAIHYKDTARDEVLKKLIPKSLREAFDTKAISPISSPTIERIDFDVNHLSYEAHVEIRPKIKLEKYKGIVIKQKPILIEESEMNEALRRIQESHAKYVPLENRPAQMGDFVICDYICLVDGKEIEKRTEDMISIKEKDYLEGFSKQLVGVQAGEMREVKIQFPENYTNKTYAGKEATFKVSVKELKTREMPVLNDDFAKEVGDFQSLNDLREKIRLQIENRKKEEKAVETENALLEELLKKSKFDIPKRMVERRADAMLEETLHSLRHQGMAEEADGKQKDALLEKMKPEAERQVRISFLLDEIAVKEKIEVTGNDYQSKYDLIAKQYRRPVEEISTHFEKTEGRKDSLALQIINEKVIQLIKDHAVIKTD